MTVGRRAFFIGASQVLAFCGTRPLEAESAAGADLWSDPRRRSSMPDGAVSRFVRVNGIDLHYVVAGSGPPIVLLHGWPQTWFAWRDTMQRLSRRFTVIAPDLRGIGLSQRTAEGYDKRTIADDIRGLIVHAANGKAHVVGHDMGGKVAFVLAHLHPECVTNLVMVDCLVPGSENMDAMHGGAWHYGFHMARDIPELLTAGREQDYIRAQIRGWSHRKAAVSDDDISEFAHHYASPGGMTAGFNLYRALPEDAALVASFGSRKLAMPVLAIAGRHGVGTKLADMLRDWTDHLTTAISEDSGHFVPQETPDFFCARVERFLTT